MSNRLTFSLASLVFLIALGLVFVPTSVMAHDASITPATNEAAHPHPLLETVPADSDATPPTTQVTAHGHHPMVTSIALKPAANKVRGNMVVVGPVPNTATGNLDPNQFILIVTFDRPVVDAPASTDHDTDNDDDVDADDALATLAATEILHSVRDKMRVALATQTEISFAAATQNSIKFMGDARNKFEVVVTATGDAVPTGMAADDNEKVILRVQIAAGAVFSLQTTPDAPDGVGTVTVPGGASSASSVYEFTLVNTLPSAPMAPDAPTNLTAMADHAAKTITLDWDEPSAGTSPITKYTVTKTYMADGTAATPKMISVTAPTTGGAVPTTVTIPGENDDPLPENVEFTFTVTATSEDGTSDRSDPATALIDTAPPTVEVKAPTKEQAMANTDGTLTFMIRFNEALGSGLSALQVTDFEIEGGSATAADLTGPNMDAKGNHDYDLEVTPDTAGGSVTVTLMPNMVADVAGNALADVDAMGNTPSDTFDTTPPTVEITAPTEPDEDGNLTFTFDFSEKVQPETITLDRSGSDNVRLGENSDPMVDADDDTIYTILVEPRDPEVDTTVLLLKGSVMDMAGNGLAADAEATYMVDPPSDDAPILTGKVPDIVIWAGHNYKTFEGDFPKATDTEGAGDRIRYRIEPALPDTFELTHDDLENRYLEITAAAAMSKKEYQYIAYNELADETTVDSDPIKFNITVLAQRVPTAPTMVIATEEGAVDPSSRALLTAIRARTVNTNNVFVDWTAPVDPTTPPRTLNPVGMNADVPFGSAITSYNVYRHDEDEMQQAVYKVTEKADIAATSYTTDYDDGLPVAKYIFTVSAVNGVGEGPQSKNPDDDDNVAIVLNPPNPPYNVDPSADEAGKVTLSWLPEESPLNTPVYMLAGATTPAEELMYGNVQYHLIHITPPGANTDTIEEADGNTTDLIDTELKSIGTYTFRVSAVNIDGVGERSVSDVKYEVTRPIAASNRPPSFGDYTIDDFKFEVDDRIGMTLGAATDPEEDKITYSLLGSDGSALPTGLNFNADTRRLSASKATTAMEGEYTYKVTQDDDTTKSDALTFYIEVVDPTVTPTGRGTEVTSLPAKGLIVYVRDLEKPPHFGTSNPRVAEWSAMPNLEALFNEGGGGSLQLTVNGVTKRQVVFSEIMWAVDEGKVGQDSYDGNQWIELYNRTDKDINISDISFAVKADGRPALPESTDLVSNVVGGGSDWIKAGKGQNGNSADGSKKEFRSMYRKRYHNDSAGWSAGEWLEATQVYHPNFKGTPGTAEPKAPTTFPESPVALGTVFNEISNSSNSAHEWIELRKRDGELTNLENWVVHIVTSASDRAATANPTQRKLFQIPKLNDGRYGNILLITRTDPARDDSHPLRGGYNVEVADEDQANEGRDKNIRYYVADDWTINLPDNGEFVLILRHGADKTNHEKVQDVAGYHPNLKVDRADFFSNLWPLRGFPAPGASGWTQNKLGAGTVHRRQHDGIAGTKRSRTDRGNNADDGAFRDVGWTGIGYKRNADAGAKNGGTPGYPNNALQSNETEASGDPVIISEIMYATGDRGNIPQWIELRNTSQTVGVNLDGWRVTIVNHDQDSADETDTYEGDLVKQYNINGKIPPGQTFLITAHSGTDNTNLPSERIISIRNRRGEVILSQYGFEITLETKGKDNNDANRKLADKVGNLAAGADARFRGNPQSYETPAWMLPAGTNADGDRVSIVRVSDSRGLIDGLKAGAWRSFDHPMSAHPNAPESTYYGNRNDLASPGYTVDGVLPVSLSKFRPERLATGEVVVRWATESETNNAGFNILRGEKLDGEFTKLNEQLIAGKGTTSEKNGYEFVDTSAKPNVVYYYQIQDVSLDGEVATLKTTHLRGNISVAGKLTTTWGELKALQ